MTFWRFCALLSLPCLLASAGCESPNGLHGIQSLKAFFSPSNNREQEARYRKEFQTRHTRKALRWLLANCVQQGMSIQDVNNVIGVDGELEENSGFLKRGTTYRVDDKAYRYGPDDGGRVVYLFFREGKLVNFDSEHFADVDSVKS